jgi:putative glutamine amidotransferase
MLRRKPLIGIPASVRLLEHAMEFHGTAGQYLRAVREHVGATVFTIPGLSDTANAMELLDSVNGVLLTGSFSNIHPSSYGESVATAEGFYDQNRDAVTLPLIRAALERAIPIFGICRGMQELNVALGGTLHQMLHEAPGKADHRANENLPLEAQFGPAHDIEIVTGGVLASLISDRRLAVNTAHAQGINRVAETLRVEAVSDDGTVEALSVKSARAFAVAVQFHPEWGTPHNPLYKALFAAFRSAVWLHANAPQHPVSAVLRQAMRDDLPDLLRVRYAVSENRPSRIIPDSQVIEELELTGRGWVIELDGVIAAFAIGDAVTGSVFALFVDPSHQGHGYGRRLHDTVVEWLWSRGLDRIWLNTQPGTRAQLFYEKLGWQCRGTADSGQLRLELLKTNPTHSGDETLR